MCGIAGIFNFNNVEQLQTQNILNMTNQMMPRGPDDEGFLLVNSQKNASTFYGDDTPENCKNFLTGGNSHISAALQTPSILALGHRRLSILDLTSAGHQPMTSADNRYWIVYNGEIYNSKDIAKELTNKGIILKGHSDTEVLLYAFQEWGEKCLDKLNGMFAFAIWDNVEKTLFCARDRIGIKPFYYSIQNDKLIFASDIKTIISSGHYSPEPSCKGLYLAMTFGIAPRPLTAFKNIYALEQAHWMKVTNDGIISKQRYWHIPIGTQDHTMSEKQAMDLVEEQLYDSIKRRLIADVPVGTFMSGGVDSTLISAMAASIHPGIKAFTLGYENAPELDEVSQAKATAELYDMDHIIKTVRPDESLQFIDEWIKGYEEPCNGMAVNYIISGVVKDNNVKVSLNGLGGDELFAGYSYYKNIDRWKMLQKFGPLLKFSPLFLGNKGERLYNFARATTVDRFHSAFHTITFEAELQKLFQPTEDYCYNSAEIIHNLYINDLEFEDDIEAMSYIDLMSYIGNHHVHRLDQFTMAHSIEGRVPFLDHKLVEAAYKIPSKYKLKDNNGKYILKKVAEKYIAPECINMPKKGFSLPIDRWVYGLLKNKVKENLNDLKKRSFINDKFLNQFIANYGSRKLPSMQVWHMVSLELWFKSFMKDN